MAFTSRGPRVESCGLTNQSALKNGVFAVLIGSLIATECFLINAAVDLIALDC
jgi:hypothetical protein